ncbi:unnamed protein product, partial [Ectocarpus sp. 6 AP-2014]
TYFTSFIPHHTVAELAASASDPRPSLVGQAVQWPQMEDIFGPEPTADTPAEAAASETNKNLEEFDDIFGDASTAEAAADEGAGGSSSEQAKDAPAAPAAASGGSGLDEFDDIFGDSEPVEAANAGEKEDVAAGGAPSATE